MTEKVKQKTLKICQVSLHLTGWNQLASNCFQGNRTDFVGTEHSSMEKSFFEGQYWRPTTTTTTTRVLGPRFPRWAISRLFHLTGTDSSTPWHLIINLLEKWCHRSTPPARLMRMWYLWVQVMWHSGWNSNLALTYQTHANRAHPLFDSLKNPSIGHFSPEYTKRDFSTIVYNNSQLHKLPARERK